MPEMWPSIDAGSIDDIPQIDPLYIQLVNVTWQQPSIRLFEGARKSTASVLRRFLRRSRCTLFFGRGAPFDNDGHLTLFHNHLPLQRTLEWPRAAPKGCIRSPLAPLGVLIDLLVSIMSPYAAPKEKFPEIEFMLMGLQVIQFLNTTHRMLLHIFAVLLMFILQPIINLTVEFAGRMRPSCTTMPWTIWPALVVLWGVCWMFYPPNVLGFLEDDVIDYPFPSLPWPEDPQGNDIWSHAGLPLHDSIPEELSFDFDQMIDPQALQNDFHLDTIPEPVQTAVEGRFSLNQRPDGSAATIVADESMRQNEGSRLADFGSGISLASGTKELTCPQCPHLRFARPFTLGRHLETQHSNAVLVCPGVGCKRSKAERGFKREDQLQRHKKVCAMLDGAKTPEDCALTPRRRRKMVLRRTSEGEAERVKGTEAQEKQKSGRRLAKDDSLVDEMKTMYHARMEALEAKELECQQERARLEKLGECIRSLEEQEVEP